MKIFTISANKSLSDDLIENMSYVTLSDFLKRNDEGLLISLLLKRCSK
jgi:hypothetical protein